MIEEVTATQAAWLINRNDKVIRKLIAAGDLAATPAPSRRKVQPGKVGPVAWRIRVADLLACPYMQVIPERLHQLDPLRPTGDHRTPPDDGRTRDLEAQIARLKAQLAAQPTTEKPGHQGLPPITFAQRPVELPPGSMLATAFGKLHHMATSTLYSQIEHNRRRLTVIVIDSGSSDGRKEYWLTPELQAEAIPYWDSLGSRYMPCKDCPHTLR